MKGFVLSLGHSPCEIILATDGFKRGKGKTLAPIAVVHKDHPLRVGTLQQLDGVFGAERTGGWKGSAWSTDAARGPEGNIRTWGELGLKGEWADKPIHLYGFDATLSNWSDLIQRVVFKGGDKWNPTMKEMVRGGSKAPADAQIVQAVADDKFGIGFNLMRVVEKEARVKPLAIAAADAGPLVAPPNESNYRRTYPLANAVYIYVNRVPGRPISPRVREFLAYILSREGQQDVVADGMYLPLNPEAARIEREKLR